MNSMLETLRALLDNATDAQLDEVWATLGLSIKELPRDAAVSTKGLELRKRAAERGGETLADLEELLWEQQNRPEMPEETRPTYWLYFSCSEKERADNACQQFFADLTERLRVHLAARGHSFTGEIRFFDERNLESPEKWPPWSLRAIRQCRVVVCLFSKSYFQDEYCGQVWTAFSERVKACQEQKRLSFPPPVIVPILWKSAEELRSFLLPAVARKLTALSPPPPRNEMGIHSLLQMAAADRDGAGQVYKDTLDEVARKIVTLSVENPLQPAPVIPRLNDVRPAFHRFDDPEKKENLKGIDIARFVIMAGRKEEMVTVRGEPDADAYDTDPERWCPYFPPDEVRFSLVASREANKLDMTAYYVAPGPQLAGAIDQYAANSNVIVGLVDPWTLQLPPYGAYAKACYEKLLKIGAILLCWNTDPETV